MQVGRFCLSWKVIAGLGVAALALAVFARPLLGAALPFLLVAACPLSMLLMMGGMSRMGGRPAGAPGLQTGTMRTRDEQLADARAQLADLNAREVSLDAYIRALEVPEPEQLPSGAGAPKDSLERAIPTARVDSAG